MPPKTFIVGLTLLVLLWAAPGRGHEEKGEGLGQVHFPVSCTAAAQAQFDRAAALRHSFWFAPAIQTLTAVTEFDPACAMGHWGVAMSLLGNPFAWPPSPAALKDSWAAGEKAKAAGAKTAREQLYIAAVEAFYKDAETVDQRTRTLAYEYAIAQLAGTYRDDREASIFYALALNATALPTDKKYTNQLKAALLEKVFAEQPQHPGVAHYLIHSDDYPAIAPRGLDAARRYAGIALAAPHALHMPSRIFTRLGFWQESIDTNRASADTAREEPSTTHQQEAGSYNALHAMDYMIYGYLQLGQEQAAKRLLEEIAAIQKLDVEYFAAAYAFAAMPARYALERRQWAEAAALTLHPKELAWNKFPQAEAVFIFARGLGAARSGNVTAARQDLNRLQALREAQLAAKQNYWAEQTEIQRQGVTVWVAYADGKPQDALEGMRAAVAHEDATEKHPVTPGAYSPKPELFWRDRNARTTPSPRRTGWSRSAAALPAHAPRAPAPARAPQGGVSLGAHATAPGMMPGYTDTRISA
jgi:hypothetical protein